MTNLARDRHIGLIFCGISDEEKNSFNIGDSGSMLQDIFPSSMKLETSTTDHLFYCCLAFSA
jgi:hypothetical protein